MPSLDRNRGRTASGGFEPNLTPLLDIVLQLITFFMMLIHFGSQVEAAAREVRLPIAPTGLPGADLALGRLVAAIDAQGRLLDLEGRPLDHEGAADWWREAAEARRSDSEPAAELPTVVIVRADRDATYGDVRRALLDAQAAGFARFTLIVIRELAR